MKINVWHSIEECTIDASIDQWHSWLKTYICAEGEQYKHMTKLICRKTKNIYRN